MLFAVRIYVNIIIILCDRFGVFKNLSLFWSDLHTPCIVPEVGRLHVVV